MQVFKCDMCGRISKCGFGSEQREFREHSSSVTDYTAELCESCFRKERIEFSKWLEECGKFEPNSNSDPDFEIFVRPLDPNEVPRPPSYNRGKLETLAALEHEQWMHWTQAVWNSIQNETPDGIEIKTYKKWSKNWKPYEELDEDVKEQDRRWARKVIKIIGTEA